VKRVLIKTHKICVILKILALVRILLKLLIGFMKIVKLLLDENDKPMMLISLEDYNAIEETAYLLRSPANAERLRASIKQYEQGKTVKKNLLES